MSTKKYRIRLTTDEQQELNALVSRGRAAAYKQTHARILLMSDESRSRGNEGRGHHQLRSVWDSQRSSEYASAVWRRAVESALNRKKQLRRTSKETGRQKVKQVDSDGLRGTAGGACQLDPEAVG